MKKEGQFFFFLFFFINTCNQYGCEVPNQYETTYDLLNLVFVEQRKKSGLNSTIRLASLTVVMILCRTLLSSQMNSIVWSTEADFGERMDFARV